MADVQNILTRFALVERAKKILKDTEEYFNEAAGLGLSVEAVDPSGELVALRKGLITMLEREEHLKDQPKSIAVEEDGDEIFIPFADVRCWHRMDCGGAKLVKARHDNNDSMHWRCPKCGGYYGEAGK